MDKYVIGIDGGGTKTHFVALENNIVIYESFEKSINLSSNNYEDVFLRLEKLFNDFLRNTKKIIENCQGICIGTAGVGIKSNVLKINEIISKIININKSKLYIIGDHEIALYGETRGEGGIILISGTGSICIGMGKNKKIIRAGGRGHLIGDLGSGYDIGRQLATAIVEMHDGIIAKTDLYNIVFESTKSKTINDFLEIIYNQEGKKSIAELSLIADNIVDTGDDIVNIIYKNSAKSLYKLFVAVHNKMDMGVKNIDLILSGGTILNSKQLRSMVKELIKKDFKNINIKDISVAPAIGAAYYAFDINNK